jgi:hypothetical protein
VAAGHGEDGPAGEEGEGHLLGVAVEVLGDAVHGALNFDPRKACRPCEIDLELSVGKEAVIALPPREVLGAAVQGEFRLDVGVDARRDLALLRAMRTRAGFALIW